MDIINKVKYIYILTQLKDSYEKNSLRLTNANHSLLIEILNRNGFKEIY